MTMEDIGDKIPVIIKVNLDEGEDEMVELINAWAKDWDLI